MLLMKIIHIQVKSPTVIWKSGFSNDKRLLLKEKIRSLQVALIMKRDVIDENHSLFQ